MLGGHATARSFQRKHDTARRGNVLILGCLCLVATITMVGMVVRSGGLVGGGALGRGPHHTLVVYAYYQPHENPAPTQGCLINAKSMGMSEEQGQQECRTAIADTLWACGDNFRYFLEHGLLPPAPPGEGEGEGGEAWPHVTYLITVLADSPIPPALQRVLDAQAAGDASYSNVVVRRMPNQGNDLCLYGRTLRDLAADTSAVTAGEGVQLLSVNTAPLLPSYDYYTFVNCGVRGPYVPGCSPAAHDAGHKTPRQCSEWLRRLHRALDPRAPVPAAMAGVTMNCEAPHPPHVQSDMIMFNRLGREVVAPRWAATCTEPDKQKVIILGEVGLTGAVTAAGFNVASLQPYLVGMDWRGDLEEVRKRYPWQLDLCYRIGNPHVCRSFLPDDHPDGGCKGSDPHLTGFTKVGGGVMKELVSPPGLLQCVRDLDAGKVERCVTQTNEAKLPPTLRRPSA